MRGIPDGTSIGPSLQGQPSTTQVTGMPSRKSRIAAGSEITHIRSHGLVDRSPPDLVLGGLLLDNALVGGRTTSLSTRVGAQSPAGGDGSTGLVNQSIFVESRHSRVGDLQRGTLVMRTHRREHGPVSKAPYDSNTVIVNVRSLVELLLQLGVTLARPGRKDDG